MPTSSRDSFERRRHPRARALSRADTGASVLGVSAHRRGIAQPLRVRVLCSLALLWVASGFVVLGLADSGWVRYGGVAAGCALAALVARFWRLRVVLGDEAIDIVNWLRTVRIPWSQVERFGLDVDGGAWVRRRDMRHHGISAFGAARSDPFGIIRRGNTQAVERLEAARKKRRRSGGGHDR